MGRLFTAFILTFALVACGSGGGEASAPQGETLADFFGGPGTDDPEAAEAEFRAQEMEIQEAIAVCMAEQGFEYIPVQPPEGSHVVFDETDHEEQVRKQGFGITTWYGNEEEMTEEAVEWEDPNQPYVDGLSESEREAYYEALHGNWEEDAVTEIDPETGEEVQVMHGFGSGCEGQAHEAVYGDQEKEQALWEELNPALEQMHERIQADPRIVEANKKYSACMADRGYEIEKRDDIWQTVHEDFQARLDEIIGPDGGYQDPFEGWSQDEIDAFFEEKTEGEIEAFFAETEAQSREQIDQEALAALQQEEIDMAVADFECGKPLDGLYEEVAVDYERDFIAEHRDTLEQIRDAQDRGE